MARDLAHVQRLSRKLHKGIVEAIPHVVVNGSMDSRYPGNLNVSFAYVEGESLIMALKDVAVSSGDDH